MIPMLLPSCKASLEDSHKILEQRRPQVGGGGLGEGRFMAVSASTCQLECGPRKGARREAGGSATMSPGLRANKLPEAWIHGPVQGVCMVLS